MPVQLVKERIPTEEILRRYGEGEDMTEIAKSTGCNRTTLYKRVYKAGHTAQTLRELRYKRKQLLAMESQVHLKFEGMEELDLLHNLNTWAALQYRTVEDQIKYLLLMFVEELKQSPNGQKMGGLR